MKIRTSLILVSHTEGLKVNVSEDNVAFRPINKQMKETLDIESCDLLFMFL